MAHDHGQGGGLEFHLNKGQWPEQVLYRAMTKGGAVFLERDAFTYVVRSGGVQAAHGQPDKAVEASRMHAYKVHFEGAAAKAHEGMRRMHHYANYFLGNDKSKWAGGVPVFGGVELSELYPGIGMHVDGQHGMEYDWIVAPGADASRIVMRFEGQDKLWLDAGMLHIGTSAGTVIEQRPVAWQDINGARHTIASAYVLDGERVHFEFPEGYDARYALVIDPVVSFASFTGSTADNFGFTATYDNTGHLYAGGIAFGIGYPVTTGVLQGNYGGDTIDMSITKFSLDGSSLEWSTYLGGSAGNESPHSMVVNDNDELYVMGTSGASDFPTTPGCFDGSFGAGPAVIFVINEGYNHLNGVDVVVAHFSSDATSLIGSTFVGGSQADGMNLSIPLDYNYGDPFRGEIVLDDQQRPVVATCTISTDIPTTGFAASGGQDGYAFRMDPELTTQLWATYYGGVGDDACYSAQLGATGEIFLTGGTVSGDLPMAGIPFTASNQGGVDGFIARFSADGTSLLSATYLGTSSYDQSYFVQLDPADFVYVVGQTHGAYTVSPGRYSNIGSTQFIQKLDHDLGASLWSTVIGSSLGYEDIAPSAFLVSECGQIYFSGWGGAVNHFGQATLSTTVGLPITPDAHQPNTDGSDFYLMVLEADAVALSYATFFGGTISQEHVDGGTSRFDKDGVVYQAVCGGCGGYDDFPTTPGAWSNTNDSFNCNLAAFKIDFEQNVQVNIEASITATGLCITEPIVLTASGTATSWVWDLGDGSPQETGTTLAHLYEEPGFYTIMLIGTNTGLCVVSDTATLVIEVVARAVLDPEFAAIPNGTCDAFEVELFNSSTGSNVFYWTFGDGGTSVATNPVHPYGVPGTYDITLGVVDAVCADTAFTSQQVVIAVPGLELDLVSPEVLCDGASIQLSAGTGFDSYLWSTGEEFETITVTDPGEYTVAVADGFCVSADTINVLAAQVHPPLADLVVCPEDAGLLTIPYPMDTAIWSTGATGSSLAVQDEGVYWFVGEDSFGCAVSDTAVVTIAALVDAQVVVPNVFTPNGDGENDLFLVKGVQGAGYDLTIYDRWGLKMFRTNTMGLGWNGRVDNSDGEVPDGTYYVVVTYKEFCSNDPEMTHTGHVTLLR